MSGVQRVMETDKILKDEGRGASDWTNSNTTVLKWNDDNIVPLPSNSVGPEQGPKMRRWSAKDHCYNLIDCPPILHEYNTFMGGLDLCVKLLPLYQVPIRSRKWYMPIFFYLVKFCNTNAWLDVI